MNIKKKLLTMAILSALSISAMAADPTNAEIMQMMKEMKEEMAELKKENEKLKEEVSDVAGSVDAVADATDEAIQAQVKLSNKTTIGGYGELHYNSHRDNNGDDHKSQIDFHRFVLFVNHEFNDKMRLVSELELEHSVAGDGAPGEVELEQAYIQYDLTQKTSLTGGLFLMPVGILNETHEPPTFYGVERNDVEKNIIPTTWWEGGAMVQHEIMDGLTTNLAITSGLKSDDPADDEYAPRDARQKVAEADASTFAYTGRLKYTGLPGMEVAGTINYQDNFCQDEIDGCGAATLYEGHVVYNKDSFGLRALYAWWDIDGSAPKAIGADEQHGYYVEPSYRFDNAFVAGQDIGIFGRYAVWNNLDGSQATLDNEYIQYNVGANWWIDKDVVVKIDYQIQDVGSGVSKELDGLNLGIGYQF
ncbi:porin [Methylophilaceae bacterium]|nr:porin [Methylophilaceae bacterium]